MRLNQIKPLHILEFLEPLSRTGDRMGFRKGKVSSGTIEVVHRVLKNIFTRVVEWKLLKENPVAKIKKPRVKHKDVRPYDEQEIKLLLIALQQAPIHWRVMITLVLITGLRRGELLGLEWHHIDWETGVISVEQSATLSLAAKLM